MNQPPSRRRNKAIPAASDDSTLPNDLAEEDISQQEDPATATITVTAVEIPELTEQEISDRIASIYSDSLEETAKSLLQLLGKLNRPWLTAVEEKLLSVLESEYSEIL